MSNRIFILFLAIILSVGFNARAETATPTGSLMMGDSSIMNPYSPYGTSGYIPSKVVCTGSQKLAIPKSIVCGKKETYCEYRSVYCSLDSSTSSMGVGLYGAQMDIQCEANGSTCPSVEECGTGRLSEKTRKVIAAFEEEQSPAAAQSQPLGGAR